MSDHYENHHKWEKIVALSKRSANRNQQILLQISKFEEINAEMAKKTEKLKKDREEALMKNYSRTQPFKINLQEPAIHYKSARQLKFQPFPMPYYKNSKIKASKKEDLEQLLSKSRLPFDQRKSKLDINPGTSCTTPANIGYHDFRNQNNQNLIGLKMLKDNQNIKLPSANVYKDYESFVKKANSSSSFAKLKSDIATQTSSNYSPENNISFHKFNTEKHVSDNVDKPEITIDETENLNSKNKNQFQLPITENKPSTFCSTAEQIPTAKLDEIKNTNVKILGTKFEAQISKSEVDIPTLTDLRNNLDGSTINSNDTRIISNYSVIPKDNIINSENHIFNSEDSITKSETSSTKLKNSNTASEDSSIKSKDSYAKPENSTDTPKDSIAKPEDANTKAKNLNTKPEESIIKAKNSITEPINKTIKAEGLFTETENSINKLENSSRPIKSDDSITNGEDSISMAEESKVLIVKSEAQNMNIEHLGEKLEISMATEEVAENQIVKNGNKQSLLNAKTENLIANRDDEKGASSQKVIAENKLETETFKDSPIDSVIVENSMKFGVAKSENKQKNTFSFLASSDEEDEDSFFDFLQSTAKSVPKKI